MLSLFSVSFFLDWSIQFLVYGESEGCRFIKAHFVLDESIVMYTSTHTMLDQEVYQILDLSVWPLYNPVWSRDCRYLLTATLLDQWAVEFINSPFSGSKGCRFIKGNSLLDQWLWNLSVNGPFSGSKVVDLWMAILCWISGLWNLSMNGPISGSKGCRFINGQSLLDQWVVGILISDHCAWSRGCRFVSAYILALV